MNLSDRCRSRIQVLTVSYYIVLHLTWLGLGIGNTTMKVNLRRCVGSVGSEGSNTY